jgi:hypothetical protein
MGLILLNPSPRGLNYTNDGLPTGMNMHVLDRDLLLALAAVPISVSSNRAKARVSLPACLEGRAGAC